MSTASTFCPSLASDAARLMVVVVLPTPPFWLATARSRLNRLIDQFAWVRDWLGSEDRESHRLGQSNCLGARGKPSATPSASRNPVQNCSTWNSLATRPRHSAWLCAATGPAV